MRHDGDMKKTSIHVYGIRNCDTVKKARQWLDDHGQPHQFHDFKTAGVTAQLLDHWMAQIGWEALLNRKGTTWRQLDETARASAADAPGARAVMVASPSVIKRPVVAWGDPDSTDISVGFNAELWESRRV